MTRPFGLSAATDRRCSHDESGPNGDAAGQTGNASGGRGTAGAANSGGLNPFGGHAGASGGTSISGNTAGDAEAVDAAITAIHCTPN